MDATIIALRGIPTFAFRSKGAVRDMASVAGEACHGKVIGGIWRGAIEVAAAKACHGKGIGGI